MTITRAWKVVDGTTGEVLAYKTTALLDNVGTGTITTPTAAPLVGVDYTETVVAPWTV